MPKTGGRSGPNERRARCGIAARVSDERAGAARQGLPRADVERRRRRAGGIARDPHFRKCRNICPRTKYAPTVAAAQAEWRRNPDLPTTEKIRQVAERPPLQRCEIDGMSITYLADITSYCKSFRGENHW